MRQYNVTCDRCGFEFKNHQLQKEWTGQMVCSDCWEPRHPQDFAKIPRTEKALPWTRPEPADVFVTVDYVSSTVGTQESTIPTGNFNNGV